MVHGIPKTTPDYRRPVSPKNPLVQAAAQVWGPFVQKAPVVEAHIPEVAAAAAHQAKPGNLNHSPAAVVQTMESQETLQLHLAAGLSENPKNRPSRNHQGNRANQLPKYPLRASPVMTEIPKIRRLAAYLLHNLAHGTGIQFLPFRKAPHRESMPTPGSNL